MAPGNLSVRQQPYTPRVSSPLNPLSPETPKRHKRKGHKRAAKHEQSPTQKLLRRKAAVAWKLISRGGNAINTQQTTHDGAEKKAIDQEEGSHKVCVAAEYCLKSASMGEYWEAVYDLPGIDMEKQAHIDGYKGDWSLEIRQLSSVWTTRRLVITIGLLCVVGVLSAIRLVSRIQAWRT